MTRYQNMFVHPGSFYLLSYKKQEKKCSIGGFHLKKKKVFAWKLAVCVFCDQKKRMNRVQPYDTSSLKALVNKRIGKEKHLPKFISTNEFSNHLIFNFS